MKVLRFFVLGWMVLWLASSGVLAAAMPLCAHTPGQHGDHTIPMQHHDASVQQDGDAHEHADHQHHGSTQAKGEGKSAGFIGFVCDNCDLCHLATSLVPTGSSSNVLFLAKRIFPVGADVTIPSRFPEQPQRIPLAQRA